MTNYMTPDPENLPPESILNSVRIKDSAKPSKALMTIFQKFVDEVDEEQMQTIDYYDFGRNWLSLFNYGAHKDQSQIPIMDWVSQVSRSPYLGVKILRGTEVVGIVPPIFGRIDTVLKDDKRDYFMQLAVQRTVQLANGSHQEQEISGILERNFTDRLIVDRRLRDNFHAMTAIFELYGVQREIPDWIKQLDGAANIKKEEEVVQVDNTSKLSNANGMIEDDD